MLFKKNGDGRSSMQKIAVNDVFESIVLVSHSEKDNKEQELQEQGYLALSYVDVSLGLFHMVKPTQAIIDYMAKVGYDTVTKVDHCEITNSISFASTWGDRTSSIDTTYQNAGVVDLAELDAFKESAEYVSSCLVNKAYAAFHKEHPNYATAHIKPTGSRLSYVSSLARNVWKAVGHALKNEKILEKANNGDYDNFYNNIKHLEFLKDKFSAPVYLPKKESSLTFG